MNENNLEIRTLLIDDLDTSHGTDLKISGYANVTGSVSELMPDARTGRPFQETIKSGTFQDALGRAEKVEFLDAHNKSRILSSTVNDTLVLKEDKKGLHIDAVISPTSWGKDVYQLIKDKIIQGLSFGMTVLKEDWTIGDNGYPLRTISKIKLSEVSATRNPAYRSSSLETRAIEQSYDVSIPENLEMREDNLEKEVKDSEISEIKEDVAKATEAVTAIKEAEVVEEVAPVVETVTEAPSVEDSAEVSAETREATPVVAPISLDISHIEGLENSIKVLTSSVKSLSDYIIEKRDDGDDESIDDSEDRSKDVKEDIKKDSEDVKKEIPKDKEKTTETRSLEVESLTSFFSDNSKMEER